MKKGEIPRILLITIVALLVILLILTIVMYVKGRSYEFLDMAMRKWVTG
ncbi:MAG: hypothetical protein J7L45_00345 [Candidatus Aenigmarchaeota archaeon]|nr:hypothetical protein [Candidatus Aenigmarchaeota archaeon]